MGHHKPQWQVTQPQAVSRSEQEEFHEYFGEKECMKKSKNVFRVVENHYFKLKIRISFKWTLAYLYYKLSEWKKQKHPPHCIFILYQIGRNKKIPPSQKKNLTLMCCQLRVHICCSMNCIIKEISFQCLEYFIVNLCVGKLFINFVITFFFLTLAWIWRWIKLWPITHYQILCSVFNWTQSQNSCLRHLMDSWSHGGNCRFFIMQSEFCEQSRYLML